jgi:hypothetical protein
MVEEKNHTMLTNMESLLRQYKTIANQVLDAFERFIVICADTTIHDWKLYKQTRAPRQLFDAENRLLYNGSPAILTFEDAYHAMVSLTTCWCILVLETSAIYSLGSRPSDLHTRPLSNYASFRLVFLRDRLNGSFERDCQRVYRKLKPFTENTQVLCIPSLTWGLLGSLQLFLGTRERCLAFVEAATVSGYKAVSLHRCNPRHRQLIAMAFRTLANDVGASTNNVLTYTSLMKRWSKSAIKKQILNFVAYPQFKWTFFI